MEFGDPQPAHKSPSPIKRNKQMDGEVALDINKIEGTHLELNMQGSRTHVSMLMCAHTAKIDDVMSETSSVGRRGIQWATTEYAVSSPRCLVVQARSSGCWFLPIIAHVSRYSLGVLR